MKLMLRTVVDDGSAIDEIWLGDHRVGRLDPNLPHWLYDELREHTSPSSSTAFNAGFQSGYGRGRSEGYAAAGVGYDKGFTAGYEKGVADVGTGYDAGFNEGLKANDADAAYGEGYKAGHIVGYEAASGGSGLADDAHALGYDTGYADGYDKGYAAAREEQER